MPQIEGPLTEESWRLGSLMIDTTQPPICRLSAARSETGNTRSQNRDTKLGINVFLKAEVVLWHVTIAHLFQHVIDRTRSMHRRLQQYGRLNTSPLLTGVLATQAGPIADSVNAKSR